MAGNLRVGFVGCGLIGRSHARGVKAAGGADIVAVHDLDPARAASFAAEHGTGAGAVAPSADAVIEAADVVYVCTWTAEHPALVAAVAAAGKPVFCEKPLATSLEEAAAMTGAVSRAGVTNQVGLVLRNSPSFRWLQRQATDPAAGPLMNVVFRDDQYLPVHGLYGSTWRADRAKAGAGTLLEHSIHDLDLLRWMMGPIRSVSARMRCLHGLDGIDDQASVLLEAASGAQATLTSVWHDVLSRPSQRRVEVFCQRAVFALEGDWSGPVSAERQPAEGPAGGVESLQGPALGEVAERLDGLGQNPDAAFLDAVRRGEPAYPDFSVALEAHRLADAAYRSAAADGTPVTL